MNRPENHKSENSTGPGQPQQPCNPDSNFEEQIAVVRNVMARRRGALRKLAN